MYKYHETLQELGLEDDPKLQKLYNAGLDEVVRFIELDIKDYRRYIAANPRDKVFVEHLKIQEITLNTITAIIEGQKNAFKNYAP